MNAGHQSLWLTGSRVYFQRDPIVINGAPVAQPIIDFGRIEVVSPGITVGEAVLFDSDGGINRPIARAVNSIDETYEVRCSNLNQDNSAVLWMANSVEGFTQASTPVTGVMLPAIPGRLVKLAFASGVYAYGLSSIDSVVKTTGSTALVAGVDYDVVSLERGLIKLYESSTVFTAAGNITVGFTPKAITGQRLIHPQTTPCSTAGTGLIVWGRCGNREQTVREARMSVMPTAASFNFENFSEWTMKLSVLSDVTLPTPAGRLLYWLGDMPPLS